MEFEDVILECIPKSLKEKYKISAHIPVAGTISVGNPYVPFWIDIDHSDKLIIKRRESDYDEDNLVTYVISKDKSSISINKKCVRININ
jgi:hypothetical protein